MKKFVVLAVAASLVIGPPTASASVWPAGSRATTSPDRLLLVAGPRLPDLSTQLAELEGSDTVAHDLFGYSVVVSGTSVVVGAPGHASVAGRADVFTKAVAGWTRTGELKGSDTAAHDAFGESVAVSGSTIVVGSSAYASGAGRAYVFGA